MTKRRSAASAGPGAAPPSRPLPPSRTHAAAPHPGSADSGGEWLTLDGESRTGIPLFDVAAIRRIETAAMASLPAGALMSRAGAAAARWLASHVPEGLLLFLAGPGNNGGDALVAATRLHEQGRRVVVWLAAEPAKFPEDASRAWREASAAAVPIHILPAAPASEGGAESEARPEGTDDTAARLGATPPLPDGTAAVVDGLLGIGLSRPAHGHIAALIAFVNAQARAGLPVFALDAPSGLSADTGAGQPAVQAQRTLTFIGAKPGLLTHDGRDRAGAVDIAPIGLDYPPREPATGTVNVPAEFIAALPARQHASHKGSFGTLAIAGGSAGMVGAPLLGARAALHLGAGRVHVGFLAAEALRVDPQHPELMLHGVAELPWPSLSALVIGPGLGTGAGSARCLADAIDACAAGDEATPLLLDADALNLLAAEPALGRKLLGCPSPRILTPHPLEAARLAGCDAREIQRDRLAAARMLAHAWRAVVVLKGSGTVIAVPSPSKGGDATIFINPTGNAGLATAGTGDVLAGIIGALLAQGMEAGQAACAGVWIHGKAAEDLVAAGTGPAGLTAGELALPARARLNALLVAGASGTSGLSCASGSAGTAEAAGAGGAGA